MEPNLTVVGDDSENAPSSGKRAAPRLWRERQLSPDELFKGTNEVGTFGWFYRLEITGLFPRRVGPFATQKAALDSYEEFISVTILEPMCQLQNECGDGRYVVEGVLRLTGHLSRRTGRRRTGKTS